MSIELPGWAEEVLALVGEPWLDIDEDALRGLARTLRTLAADLLDETDDLAAHLREGAATVESEAYAAIVDRWERLCDGHLAASLRVLHDMANGLDVAAEGVVAAKLFVLGQLGALAAEIAAATAASVATFGLSLDAIPGLVEMSQVVIGNAIGQLEQEVLAKVSSYVVGDLMDELRLRVERLVAEGTMRALT